MINAHRKIIKSLIVFQYDKNIGLVWLKDDFRLKRNLALIEATKNHDQVVTFLYKKRNLTIKKLKSGGFVSLFKSLKKIK